MGMNLFTDFETENFNPPTSVVAPVSDSFSDGELVVLDRPDRISFDQLTSSLPLPNWPPMLPFELALGLDTVETILDKYGVSQSDYEYISLLPAFRKEIVDHSNIIQKDGVTYRIKAKLQSEMYLDEVHDIATNHDYPVAARLDAIKWIGKMADLEPKDNSKDSNQTNQQFNITICY